MVERLVRNEKVRGSNPLSSTRDIFCTVLIYCICSLPSDYWVSLERHKKIFGVIALKSSFSFSAVLYYTVLILKQEDNGVALCRLPDFVHVQLRCSLL